jgi:hypothetical protein
MYIQGREALRQKKATACMHLQGMIFHATPKPLKKCGELPATARRMVRWVRKQFQESSQFHVKVLIFISRFAPAYTASANKPSEAQFTHHEVKAGTPVSANRGSHIVASAEHG